MKQTTLLRPGIAAFAVVLLVCALFGAAFHEHLDPAEAQCRICAVDVAEAFLPEDGFALPRPPDPDARIPGAGPAAAATSEDAPGAPRGPPADAPIFV